MNPWKPNLVQDYPWFRGILHGVHEAVLEKNTVSLTVVSVATSRCTCRRCYKPGDTGSWANSGWLAWNTSYFLASVHVT